MNTIALPSLLSLFAVIGLNAAELPKKAPITRYSELWVHSPFTAPPKTVEAGPQEDPFKDLALKGIAPIAGGYLITLINRKNPAEAVPPIDTDQPSEYKVLRIERDPDKALGTVVYLSKGTITGSVTFDEKLSVPKPSVAKVAPKKPGTPPVPGQPVQPVPPQVPTPTAAPLIRPRVVPPPTTGTQPGSRFGGSSSGHSSSSSGGHSGGGYQRPSGR